MLEIIDKYDMTITVLCFAASFSLAKTLEDDEGETIVESGFELFVGFIALFLLFVTILTILTSLMIELRIIGV